MQLLIPAWDTCSWHQKQISQVGINNCIPQNTVGCNYLSLPEIPAPGTKVLNYDMISHTVYPKKYAHSFCFAVLCCGYTLTDFPISIRLTSLALWQSNDCPSASKATLMNMDKYFMWIHYEWFHDHSKAKHNKTVCIFVGIYCTDKLYYDTAYNTSSLMSFYHAMTGLHYIWLIFEKLKDETIAKFNKHWLRYCL